MVYSRDPWVICLYYTTSVNTIFELSKPDMLITTMIIIREIVLCIDEDFQFDQES